MHFLFISRSLDTALVCSYFSAQCTEFNKVFNAVKFDIFLDETVGYLENDQALRNTIMHILAFTHICLTLHIFRFIS